MKHTLLFLPLFACGAFVLSIAATANAQTISPVDLFVHYTMDVDNVIFEPESQFITSLVDSSISENDARIVGSNHAWLSSGGAMFGQSIYCDYMAGDMQSLSDLPSAGDDFTVVCWTKIANWQDRDMLFSAQNANGVGYSIGLHNASNGLIIKTNFGSTQASGVTLETIPSNEFAHFAVVFDDVNGVESIYLNGDAMTPNLANGWGFGDENTAAVAGRILGGVADTKLQGVMDDYAIFKGKLNETQIEQIISDGVASIIGDMPRPGDANGDGSVDADDASILAANWLSTSDVNWRRGDFNDDDIVDDKDATLMATNWGTAPQAVPEPGTTVLALMAMIALAVLRQRRV